ncbi:MAG TPA: FtsQ-type POTRA domain-containing protein [Verrucomicrobiae bacterium]|jgi:cell division septal protein FtsQ|nr:FtsQ-type POTRA domain-containing protein [Verrucomicrobiae bacterium]
MLLWKKPKNRRASEREFMLDVKLRTRQSRAQRMRILGIGLSAIFTVALVALVLWRGGYWLLDCLIYKNEAFAIQQIDVQTDGVLTPETIRKWAMVRPGENLMALDLMRVKRDLELQPPIEFVAVERILPHTLKLSVSEREPIAQTIVTSGRPGGGLAQAIYDFDEDGYTMKPLDPRWRTAPPPADERLPILVGVQAGDVQLGRPVDSSQIQAALKLLVAFYHSPMAGMVELQRVNVSVPEVLQVTTTQGAEVTFSLNNFDPQFRRWRIICDQYQKWGKAIATLDLSIDNNLPVRWVAASSVPAVLPHAIKPPRIKRKHV